MEITKQEVDTYVLAGLERLDPVTVYVTNYEPGKGKIVIECYGKAWSCFWGGMSGRNLQAFVLTCNNDYILGKMVEETTQRDFDKINEIARKSGHSFSVESEVEIAMMQNEMEECFGSEWYTDLPTCKTSEYNYLDRILDAVKAAFKQELCPEAAA